MISIYNYVPEKRADLLIESFKQIETDKKLVIAGGTSDSENYFEELRRKVADDEGSILKRGTENY